MTANTETPPETDPANDDAPTDVLRSLIERITRLEILVGAAIALLMLVLVVIEPNILEAPLENARTLLFTFGGSALAAGALVAMLWLRVPAPVRVSVLVVPFAIVNWWLLSPYFTDTVANETFSTSISEQLATTDTTAAPPEADGSEAFDATSNGEPLADDATDTTAPPADFAAPTDQTDEDRTTPATEPAEQTTPSTEPAEEDPAPAAPAGPVLLGAGQFVGLAGHEGTGDAGIFENPNGSLVLRFENFDIENGPDLEVYLVPGADQTSLPEGSIHLGALKGNIGDQNYELPPGTELPPGPYTALVWCRAFTVEFVGATVEVSA